MDLVLPRHRAGWLPPSRKCLTSPAARFYLPAESVVSCILLQAFWWCEDVDLEQDTLIGRKSPPGPRPSGLSHSNGKSRKRIKSVNSCLWCLAWTLETRWYRYPDYSEQVGRTCCYCCYFEYFCYCLFPLLVLRLRIWKSLPKHATARAYRAPF